MVNLVSSSKCHRCLFDDVNTNVFHPLRDLGQDYLVSPLLSAYRADKRDTKNTS